MPKLLKKIILSFFSFLIVFTSVAPGLSAVRAQDSNSTWYNQDFMEWYSKVYSQEDQSAIFGERYTAAQVQWVVYSLFSLPINFLGSKVQAVSSCIMAAGSAGSNLSADVDCATEAIDFITDIFKFLKVAGFAYTPEQPDASMAELIFTNYDNRPISGIKYISRNIKRLTSVPEANAQGFGYTAIDGLQVYWQGFRNIAYALSILVIIVFAFMIMFRVKISPQVVISVQSALPKVIGALILATFSYAIAGFVIDLSYVVGGLFASLMTFAGFAESIQEAWRQIVPIESTQVFGGFYILIYMLGYAMAFFITAVWSIVGTLSGLSVFGVISTALAIIVTVWVLVLVIWYAIKVPFVLLKTLVSLFVSIVVAPVQIMIGALVPTIGFGMWFKKIIAETLVFPLTGLFMFLALKTLEASMAASWGQVTQIFGAQKQHLWSPPILGSSEDMAGILWLAVSFIFITMIPKAVDIMKMLIMGEKFDYGTAIGEAVGAGKFGWNYMGGDIIRKSQEFEGLKRTAGILEYLSNRSWMPKSIRSRAGKYSAQFKDTLQKSDFGGLE